MPKGTTTLPKIELELDRLTLNDFAIIDDWAWSKASFGDMLPRFQKAVSNDVDLGELPLSALRQLVVVFRDAVKELSETDLGN
jgi:hypothetical protein